MVLWEPSLRSSISSYFFLSLYEKCPPILFNYCPHSFIFILFKKKGIPLFSFNLTMVGCPWSENSFECQRDISRIPSSWGRVPWPQAVSLAKKQWRVRCLISSMRQKQGKATCLYLFIYPFFFLAILEIEFKSELVVMVMSIKHFYLNWKIKSYISDGK